ncbi:MAG: nucleoside deaminase [Pseudobacteriovorax sp.]|nr:nucleoside deaminase [Pseudobacteriovorax sp.]
MTKLESDEFWMELALSIGQTAFHQGEVPVGAVIVKADKLIATGKNLRESSHLTAGHAEMVAIAKANDILKSSRLDGASIFVTLEPCPMCLSAIMQARFARLVFGAQDPKSGGCHGEILRLLTTQNHHKPKITSGIHAKASKKLMQEFFLLRRADQGRQNQ